VAREVSRLGRTPTQRIVLLAVGALCAYALGRWSAADEGSYPARSASGLPESVRGTPLVLDGDSLDFDGVRVRLFGIDAFERDQLCNRSDGTRIACGQTARISLERLIDGRTVACEKRDIDIYGRLVAVCFAGDIDLSAEQVREGWAMAYRRFSKDYVSLEEAARAARRGAWEGAFDPPWDWRRSRRN